MSSKIKHLADYLGITVEQAEEEAKRNMDPVKYVDSNYLKSTKGHPTPLSKETKPEPAKKPDWKDAIKSWKKPDDSANSK